MTICIENNLNFIAKLLFFPGWILAAAVFVGTPSAAEAHALLYYSVPAVGSVLTNSPAEIKICFTSPLEPHGSTIQVHDAKGKEVDKKDSHRDFKDQSLLFVSLPKLSPGIYRVSWKALSEDKHETQGHFEFTIK